MTNVTLNEYRNVCRSYTIYIVLLVTFFRISISISSVFYFIGTQKRGSININPSTGTTTYQTCKWEISSKLILRIVRITSLMARLVLKTLIQAY